MKAKTDTDDNNLVDDGVRSTSSNTTTLPQMDMKVKDISDEIRALIKEEIRKMREGISEEINRTKEQSQQEISGEEIRSLILSERNERTSIHSDSPREKAVAESSNDVEASLRPEEAHQERNEFSGLFDSQEEGNREEADSHLEPISQERNISSVVSSAIWRLVGIRTFSPITSLNTGTIGLYTVSMVVNCNGSNHKLRIWASVIGMLSFTILQIFVLSSLIAELFTEPWTVNFDINATNNKETDDCSKQDKLTASQTILVGFLSILWMLPIIQDIEEASTEEKLMNHYLKDELKGSAEVLRFSLRIRRYILPFYITATTILLILADGDVSSKNIILNFLAIGFISEADNIIAKIFFGSEQTSRMEEITQDVDFDMIFSRSDFLWIRVQGLFCAVLLCINVYVFQGAEDCYDLQERLRHVTSLLLPVGFFFVRFIYILSCSPRRNKETRCKRFLYVLSDFFCNMVALNIAIVILFIFELEFAHLFVLIALSIIFAFLEVVKRKNNCCTKDK